MTHFSRVSWAQELGIDLDALHREHPSHPDQLRNHRTIANKGAEYWAREHFLAQLEYSPEAILVEDVPPVQIRARRTRMNNYEFTNAGLEIVYRALIARGAV